MQKGRNGRETAGAAQGTAFTLQVIPSPAKSKICFSLFYLFIFFQQHKQDYFSHPDKRRYDKKITAQTV